MRGAHVSAANTVTMNRQGVYELTAIRDAGAAEGAARLATEEDLPLLLAWHADFIAEAVPDHVGDDDAMRRRLDRPGCRRRLLAVGVRRQSCR